MSLKKICLIFTIVILLIFTRCVNSKNQSKTELVIFAASSLTNAFEELETVFEKTHPNVNVVISFGSSSQLAAQILEEVPADIFASADEIQLDKVAEAGLLLDKPVVFATNSLVIAVANRNPLNIQDLDDLAKLNLKIVMALPGTPIREYGDKLIYSSLTPKEQENLLLNLVSEEANVRQVISKIALQEADAGLVYASDITPDIRSLVQGLPVHASIEIAATYPIGILVTTQKRDLAGDFLDFLIGEEGQAILKKWGFGAIQ